jgi:hypothetical protein
MNKLKILSSCAAALIVTTGAIAGGDPRDFGPVESFDSLDSITISSEEIIEQEVVSKTGLGIIITEEIHNTCKSKLNLSESNVARFKEALFSGNLYNTGPFDALGTLFSPSRWDNYFNCVEMHGVSK